MKWLLAGLSLLVVIGLVIWLQNRFRVAGPQAGGDQQRVTIPENERLGYPLRGEA